MDAPASPAPVSGTALLDAALGSYKADRLFEAVRKLDEIDELLKKEDPSHAELRRVVAAEPLCKKMRAEYAEAVKVTHEMKSDEGWSLVKDSGNIKTFYRQVAGTPIHSVRMIADLDAPLLHLLVMIAEADLYKEWVPFMEDSREMIGTGYRKIVYVKIGLPWPFEARDACCYGYTVDRLAEEGSILIVMRDSVPDDPLQLAKPMPPQPKTVRMTFHLGGLMLRPLGEKTRMYLIGNVDPQLAYIPYWLVNLCTTSLAPTAVSMFGSKAKNIDSTPHAQRLRVTKKDFYDAVRARLEEGIRKGAEVGHPGRPHHAVHQHEHHHKHAAATATPDAKAKDGEGSEKERQAKARRSSEKDRRSAENPEARPHSHLQLDIDP